METRAVLRGVRLSVDKGRLVADMIRGKKVDHALSRKCWSPPSLMPNTTTVPISTS